MTTTLADSQLGKKTHYPERYNPGVLFSVPRVTNRTAINITNALPFYGCDLWNAYELSWLNVKGKPMVAIAEINVPCDSPNIIESKSMKLYLNSFSDTKFNSIDEVCKTINEDLSTIADAAVATNLTLADKFQDFTITKPEGINIDDKDITCTVYSPDVSLLVVEEEHVEETLVSNLLKSNCPMTGQPDWATVQIKYRGNKINRESLLKYIVSFRNHNEFAEHCVETLFMDLLNIAKPKLLSVYGRYTRRGGIDINPFRTTELNFVPQNMRLYRQ